MKVSDKLKKFLQTQVIQSALGADNFDLVYKEAHKADYSDNLCEQLTTFLLEQNINPLNYVSTIIPYMFVCNNLIQNVTINNNIKNVNYGAFSSCPNLVTVEWNKNITVIPSDCFYECSELSTIENTATITTIGGCAFSGCKNLKEITLSSALKSIHEHGLDCGIQKINYLGTSQELNEIHLASDALPKTSVTVVCTDK